MSLRALVAALGAAALLVGPAALAAAPGSSTIPSTSSFGPPPKTPYAGFTQEAQVDGIATGAGVHWMAGSDRYALVADYGANGKEVGGLRIVDTDTGFVEGSKTWLSKGYARDVESVGSDTAVMAGQGFLQTFDVSNPSNPQWDNYLSITTHNVAHLPGTDLVYVSPGTGEGADNPIVDVSNPSNPHIVARYGDHGCHDIEFHVPADRLYCAGVGETQIWDISDPLNPELVSRIRNAAVSAQGAAPTHLDQAPVYSWGLGPGVHHWAVPAMGGDLLIVGDEHAGAAAPGCGTHAQANGPSASTTAGALWFYDVTEERDPRLVGWFSPDPQNGDDAVALAQDPPWGTDGAPHPGPVASAAVSGDPDAVEDAAIDAAVDGYRYAWESAVEDPAPLTRCTSHFGDVLEGRHQLVVGWYTAGTLLVDFSDPRNPTIQDRFEEDGIVWDARVNGDGLVVTGDMVRGSDLLQLHH